MTDIHDEQRICIKFCCKLKFTQKDTCDMIRDAFGGKALKNDQCCEIYREFKEIYKIEKFIREDPCDFAMADIHNEQRICIKFCCKLKFTQEDTCNMIRKAFGEKALKKDHCCKIYRKFKEIYKIKEFIDDNPCCSIDDICYENDVSYEDCQAICTDDLNLRCIASKPVPKVLTPEQKKDRLDVCRYLRDEANKDPTFISRVITGDDIWVYPDSETMQQSPQSKFNLIVFFDIKGIVHQEFVPPNQTFNADFYCDVLERLEEAVRKGRREMWNNRNWLLHHDNALTHTAQETKYLLIENNISVVRHPPNSPDLAPCDFFLFPKIKKELNKHSKTRHTVEAVTQEVLLSLQPKDFQEAFEEWQKRWDQCIKSKGDYIK
ncbi:histone-lysine n-methyltransferase setmar-like protein [Lasius niger]|uniref:Histone-lysine n-methyltransferase setmar-like protein n=1 Tax=Lasius niger TaxID=67767 RepID=A0A0J7JYP8_LASNI|nr:histone-lysine n-methyltransferase setmar-like protein [Lasius niger]